MGVMEGGGAGEFLAQWMMEGEPPADALAVDSRRFGGYADRAFRVEKAVECFAAQFSIHYPYEERPAGRKKRVTLVYETLKKLGAVFGSVYEWERPNWFAGKDDRQESNLSFQRCNWFNAVADECRCVSESVGIADLSIFSKFDIKGNDANDFLISLGANRAPINVGEIALNHVLTNSGGVASEFSVTKAGDNHYYLVCAAAAERQDEDLLSERAAQFADIEIKNVTERLGVIGIMGPKAGLLLENLSDTNFSQSEFPWLTAQKIVVANVEMIALRVSYVGESGWELHHEMEDQQNLFDRLWESGQQFGIGLYGAFAMNAMRLEKAYRAWGTEYTTERTPLEAGAGMFVKTDNRNFIGKEKMLQRQRGSAYWSMGLLELDDTGEDPFYSHTVLQGDKPIGIVTSGAYGHRVKKPLALAYFSTSPQDRNLFVEILGKKVPAKILHDAPYDSENQKMRV